MIKKEPSQEIIDSVRILIDKDNIIEAVRIIENIQPEDIAPILDNFDIDEMGKVFRLLDDTISSTVILKVAEGSRREILQKIHLTKLISIVKKMASDDAADIMGYLPEEIKNSVLENIPIEEAKDVRMLLKYPEDTAGGIMQREYVSVKENMTVYEAIEAIKSLKDETGDIHNIFVVDRQGKPTGILPLHRLILESPNTKVSTILENIPVRISVNLDQEEVANYFKKYDEISLPVIDENEKLVGRIMLDDIVDVLEEEASEDILKMVGVDEEELLFSKSILQVAQLRLPWILVSLLGGITTGIILWQFKVTLETVLTLAVFIPVITGMGGNVGTQSSSITVRGLATGRINISYIKWHIKRELITGSTMGVICGTLVGLFAKYWAQVPYLGLIVGISMFFAMTVASLMGTLLPLVFKKINIDPALASGPFVTTANDITGLLIYFILAAIMVKYSYVR